MNDLIENNLIIEKEYGMNFSFILNESSSFLSTEYKVLQTQSENGLIKCMRSKYNGQIQLFYLVDERKKLSDIIQKIEENDFIDIFSNLLKIIINVKNNGFLKCENLDISMDKIYVNTSTKDVALVYLPLSKSVFNSYATFEGELRSQFVKILNSFQNIYGNKTNNLVSKLTDATLNLKDLLFSLNGSVISTEQAQTTSVSNVNNEPNNQEKYNKGTGFLTLVALNAPVRTELIINKKEFVIGKDPTQVDGLITYNKTVSRVHCEIKCLENDFVIYDLGSTNGTFINNVRLQPNASMRIVPGDIIRLANSDFQVMLK